MPGGLMTLHSVSGTTYVSSFNGPICSRCDQGYIGAHACDPSVLRRKAYSLLDEAEQIERGLTRTPYVRPDNGYVPPQNIGGCAACAKSGICGCYRPDRDSVTC